MKVEPIDFPILGTAADSPYTARALAHGVKKNPLFLHCAARIHGSPSIPWKKLFDVDSEITDMATHGEILRGVAQDAPRSKILHVNLGQPDIERRRSGCAAAERRNQEYCRAQDALYVRELDGGIARLLRVPYGGKAEEINCPSMAISTCKAPIRACPESTLACRAG